MNNLSMFTRLSNSTRFHFSPVAVRAFPSMLSAAEGFKLT